jgi:hypothetical protein
MNVSYFKLFIGEIYSDPCAMIRSGEWLELREVFERTLHRVNGTETMRAQ